MHSRSKDSRRFLVIVSILAVQSLLLAWGGYRESPTCDELMHLTGGVSYWDKGEFAVYRLNPPLVRLVAALPVLAFQPKMNWNRFSDLGGWRIDTAVEEDFIEANGTRVLDLCRIARSGCLLFSWLGAFICYRWASDLYGRNAGLLSLSLWCFCPNLLAHAELITCDAGATAVGAAANYCFWRWLKAPEWLWTVATGALLGLAILTKFMWLLLFFLFPAIWLLWRLSDHAWRRETHVWLHQPVQLVVMMGVAIYTVHCGYAFEGSFPHLGKLPFGSRALTRPANDSDANLFGPKTNRFVGTWLEDVPVPLPRDLVLGVDQLNQELDAVRRPSYLHGEFRTEGWWYYYLYAAAIKVPIGFWILGFLALGAPFVVREGWPDWRDSLFVVVLPAILLALVSLQTGRMSNFRFALPAFPFLFVFAGRAARIFESPYRSLKAATVAALTWSIASSLWIYPHSLSYFNDVVGGPHNGAEHLLGSNIDWRQDLLFFRDWVGRHPEASPLSIRFYGACDPKYVGLPAGIQVVEEPAAAGLNESPHSTWYASSVNYVYWSPPTEIASTGGRGVQFLPPARPPDAKAGYSIWIWRINRDGDVSAIRN